MDIKTKLKDEIIFAKKPKGNLSITSLNKKGIITVEDFINSNIEEITKDVKRQKQFKAFQKILKYKYLNTPLEIDNLLKKDYYYYSEIDNQLKNDTMELGFGEYYFYNIAIDILEKKGYCKMIDIITNLDTRHDYLRNFYINYYNKNIKKKPAIKEERLKVIKISNNSENVENLKKKLTILLNKKEELEKEILSILEEINDNEIDNTKTIKQK